jgi:polysaccharide pyruvyl transferase WcaK-like protein
MHISILASIWAQNLWDELILKNEIKILEEKFSKKNNIPKKNIIINIFTYDLKDTFYKDKNVKYIEYFPINIKKIKNIFRNIFNFFNFLKIVYISNLIIIWWGWIIYDTENQSVWNPLKQWLFRSRILKLFNKKVEFFRVGINIKNSENLILVKKIFSCASNISVRDKYSYDLLLKLWFWKDILSIKIDPVFFDKNIQGAKDTCYNKCNIKAWELNLENIQKAKAFCWWFWWKKIWIALRDLKIKNYKENIIEIIKYFLENKCTIYLISHSFHKTDVKANDYLFLKNCRDVALQHLNFREKDIKICKNLQESYEIYTNKKIDLNLASRLHSIILSQVYEIDFIWISYSTKTDEVLKMLK